VVASRGNKLMGLVNLIAISVKLDILPEIRINVIGFGSEVSLGNLYSDGAAGNDLRGEGRCVEA
jgi:hypothetical protein